MLMFSLNQSSYSCVAVGDGGSCKVWSGRTESLKKSDSTCSRTSVGVALGDGVDNDRGTEVSSETRATMEKVNRPCSRTSVGVSDGV